MSVILIISPQPWDDHFVSKHHYAVALAKRGHRILFHGPPEPNRRMEIESVTWGGGSLGVVHSPRAAPGLRYMPRPMRNLFEAAWLRKLERLAGQAIDIVWLFEDSRFYDLRFAGSRLRIFQQMDLEPDFHTKTAAETADIAIGVASSIVKRLKIHAREALYINHGYAADVESPALPDALAAHFDGPRPHAIMIGNLDIHFLDVDLLDELVHENPGVTFHFVGKYTPDRWLHARLKRAGNAIFWGRQPAELLPAIVERADICLVSYLADQHRDQLANTHKMLEYLASGRVVLATRTLDYEGRPDLVQMAMDRESYRSMFREIVDNLDQWNAPERQARRRAFALDNTYDRQIDRIAAALGPRGRLIS